MFTNLRMRSRVAHVFRHLVFCARTFVRVSACPAAVALGEVQRVALDYEVSCLALSPRGMPAALAVGLWTDLSVRVLAVPSLAPLAVCALGGDTQVRGSSSSNETEPNRTKPTQNETTSIPLYASSCTLLWVVFLKRGLKTFRSLEPLWRGV